MNGVVASAVVFRSFAVSAKDDLINFGAEDASKNNE